MNKPNSSHLPGLEYAMTLLGEERNLQAYTSKLTEATGLARAAVDRETRVTPPLDYVPPVVQAVSAPDLDVSGRPKDYVVERPASVPLPAGVSNQSKLMITLAGLVVLIVTVNKLFTADLSMSDAFWHVLGAGLFLLCTFYFPVKIITSRWGKTKNTHDETVKK